MEFYFSETLKIEDYDGIHILQDHIGTYYSSPWNDFGYIIKFKIYYVQNTEKFGLGMINLLLKEESNTQKYLIEIGTKVEETKNIYLITDKINKDIAISQGIDIEYYEKLDKLSQKIDIDIDNFLDTVCDAGFFCESYTEYSQWDGFDIAFFRGTASEAILKKGYQIAQGKYSPEEKFEIILNNVGDTFEPIVFKFDNTRELGKTNINLLIGKNGVGKTHIIKYFSEIITGISTKEEACPYFHKLIIIAYSPFENFYTKNELFKKLEEKYNKKSKKREKRKRLNVNEYSYIGFRNNDGKYNVESSIFNTIASVIQILEYDRNNDEWEAEDTRWSILVKTLKLSMEFDKICFISKEDNSFVEINTELKKNKLKEGLYNDIVFFKNDKKISLSSGQQIYLYMIPSILAEIENESLLILDEPELYLHPQLEIELIKMLKYILDKTSSYAILASHSAIIAREVDREGISILRRKKDEELTQVYKPRIETYGQSLELLISEIFDDRLIDKPFEKEIKNLLEDNPNPEIEITKHLGDEALSLIYLHENNTDNEIEINIEVE